jgi:hypothetical protein
VPVGVGVGEGLGPGVESGPLFPLHPLITSESASNEAPMLATVRRIRFLLRATCRIQGPGAA